MKLSTAIKALGSLCLLLADGFPVYESKRPEIIGPHHIKIKALPGQQLFLYCEAFANCETDLTLIYWLINGSFPEDAPSRGRIVESEASTFEDVAILQRSLLLKNVTSQDLRSTFTCTVANAAGMAQKYTTLTRTNRGYNVGNTEHSSQSHVSLPN